MNTYTIAERNAAFMEHIAKNFDRIQELKKIMKGPNVPMHERVLAFAELHRIQHGDPHAQRRLVTELEIEATKEKNSKHIDGGA